MENIQEIHPTVLPSISSPQKTVKAFEIPRSSRQEVHQSFPHLIFSPTHYEPGYAYPLIVWLHGSGSDETQLFRVMPKISMQNYVAVAPRGLTRVEAQNCRCLRTITQGQQIKQVASLYDWSESDTAIELAENRIFESIEKTIQKYNVAERRVFLTGFDVGGTMALRIAMKYPEYFGGVISLCGQFPMDHQPLRNWKRIRNFPVLITVGSKSQVFSSQIAASQLKQFHTAGMSVSIRQYNVSQELSPLMLLDVNRWIMEQVQQTK